MAYLPKDPNMLLSVINTALRDRFPSLEALCDDYDIDREELEQKLAAINCRYDERQNRFF